MQKSGGTKKYQKTAFSCIKQFGGVNSGSFGRLENSGWRALMFVAHNGHNEIAKLLLENKADLNHKDKDGNTAFNSGSV